MTAEIFLIQEDQLASLREKGYVSEERLQTARRSLSPTAPASDQINPSDPRRWILIRREFVVPDSEGAAGRWMIDHLFVDQDGIPTLVEVKRSSNREIRRRVVGQMLDYAANGLVYWSPGQLLEAFEERCAEEGLEPEEELGELLGDGEDYYAFWEQVETNLRAGRVRLLFVADEIPPELQRIVEFLNEQMSSAEVLAVEVRQYEGDDVRTLVPRVIGATAASGRSKRSKRERKKWDEELFFEKMAEEGFAAETDVARKLLDWATQQTTQVAWTGGAQWGGFTPTVIANGVKHQIFRCRTTGLVIPFDAYAKKELFADDESRREIATKLRGAVGIDVPEDVIDRRLRIPFDKLRDSKALGNFLAVCERVVARIEGS